MSEAAANRKRPFIEGMGAVERLKAQPECAGEANASITKNIGELEESAQQFASAASIDPNFRTYYENAKSWHQELSFKAAETYIAANCLGAADKAYRRLLEFYIGSSYASVRDRAKVGIEDVREARARRATNAAGAANGSCYGNMTCNEGLSCTNGVCVLKLAAGTLGNMCYGNGTCNHGLTCDELRCTPAPATPAPATPEVTPATKLPIKLTRAR